ncbi:MAG: trypsin-like peptidase domain-containing protein [Terriglobales bacterium]
MGSGVAVSSDAVVTNDHVISDGKTWRVRRGEKSWSASVTHDDAAHDVCRLRVAGLKVRPVRLRRIANIEVGERVYAVGSPAGLEISISEGIVSGIRHLPQGDMIQMTAAISKGSSGGGLFDSSGRLIGLTTSYVEGGQSLNFALPADLVSTLDSHPTNSASMAHDRDPAFQAGVWIFYGLELIKKHATGETMDQKAAIDAFVAFIRAGQLEPDWPEPFVGIGLVDDALGEYKAAAIAYENAVKRKPDDALNWYSLGLEYQQLGDFEKAIAAHKTAVALKPDFCDAWGRLAAIYLLIQDKRREAIEAYMKVKALATVEGPSCQEHEQALRPFVVP